MYQLTDGKILFTIKFTVVDKPKRYELNSCSGNVDCRDGNSRPEAIRIVKLLKGVHIYEE